MITHNIPIFNKSWKYYPHYVSCSIINSQWLKLLLSRTNIHGPKGVPAIEIRLYLYIKAYKSCSYGPKGHICVQWLLMGNHPVTNI